nr:hypothetical protein [Tanacetum cinerariifolium]
GAVAVDGLAPGQKQHDEEHDGHDQHNAAELAAGLSAQQLGARLAGGFFPHLIGHSLVREVKHGAGRLGILRWVERARNEQPGREERAQRHGVAVVGFEHSEVLVAGVQ